MSASEDPTTQLVWDPVTLSVQGVHFGLPIALLQQHSEHFATMFAIGESDDKPIVLDDPIRPFRDWVAVLITPLQSCLIPSHPSTSNLERLLELLEFCHKYIITELETHVRALAMGLIVRDTLKAHLSANLSALRVLQIASTLGYTDVATIARTAVLAEMWPTVLARNSKKKAILPALPGAPSDHGYFVDILLFGELSGDTELAGAAYYQILIRCGPHWTFNERLTDKHRRDLEVGGKMCIDEWLQISDGWGGLNVDPLILGKAWQAVGGGKFARFDIIGRLEAARRSCRSAGDPLMIAERLVGIKESLYAWFSQEVVDSGEDVRVSETSKSDNDPNASTSLIGPNESDPAAALTALA